MAAAKAAKYIYEQAWESFPDDILSDATSLKKPEYLNTLLSTIRAKTIACLFHAYLAYIPALDAQPQNWPSLELRNEGRGVYLNADYADYFLWRGAAIILSKDVMKYILFDSMDESLRSAFNSAAHFSGLHSLQEESLSSLLDAGEYILDEADAMKASMPTYSKLCDMCSFALPEGRSVPLDFDSLEKVRNAAEAEAPDDELEIEATGVEESAGPGVEGMQVSSPLSPLSSEAEAASVEESAGLEAEGMQSSSPLSPLSWQSSEDSEEEVEERVEDIEGPPANRLRSRGARR